MPGFVTHYLFGRETIKQVNNPQLKKLIFNNRCAYALGLQGPDVFFYYFPSYLYHPENIGEIAHKKQTNLFFANLMKSRSLFDGDSKRLAIADAYILGFMGHYTLDTTAHPFVYAFTHYDAFNPPSNKDNFGQHTYLETELDNTLLLKYRRLLPSQFSMNRTIALSSLQREVISEMLAYTYQNTYRETMPDLQVTRFQTAMGTRWMYLLTRLMCDPTGKKKVIARLLEGKFIGKPMFSPMVPSDRIRFVKDPLNLFHKTWKHPWTGESSNATFEDLFAQAQEHYIRRMESYLAMRELDFHPAKAASFLREYGNLNFSSGLPCDES